MRQFKSGFIIVALLALLVACSNDEEKRRYLPMLASNIENEVLVEVINGTRALSPTTLLRDSVFSVFGIESEKNLPVKVSVLEGKEVLSFRADLPDRTLMDLWDTDEGRRGEGFADSEITVQGAHIHLRFYYAFSALPRAELMRGGSTIALQTLKYQGKTINPYKRYGCFKIVLRRTPQGFTVE